MLFPFKLSLYFLKNEILEISGLVFFHQIINHDPESPEEQWYSPSRFPC